MDKYKIDSHKLAYHPSRVKDWLDGKNIYPIYMEISPSGACNHRCTYCGLDFMEYQKRFLETSHVKKTLSELGRLGLKSVMFAGEGEPFLHKDIASIIKHTKKVGIDVGITTNGVLLGKELAHQILEEVEWIKVSINAGRAETYAEIHQTRASDFDKVITNMAYAAKVKKENNWKCVLGMQLVLLPENRHEVLRLAELSKDIGMDYLVIKPYSQHLLSKTHKYKDIKYGDYLDLSKELKKYNSSNFSLIFRINAMKKWDNADKKYDLCMALPFWSYMDAGGNIWGCSLYLGDQRFYYGNIYKESFRKIWEGEKREKSLLWVQREMDTRQCRLNCRMDEINGYLWDLKNPPAHVNFI